MFNLFKARSVSSIIAGIETMLAKLVDHEKDKLAEADRHAAEALESLNLKEEAAQAAAHARAVADKLSSLISPV